MFPRPGLPALDYVRPTSYAEAVRLLQELDGKARLLLGGTDLLPRLREAEAGPIVVVDLKGLPAIGALHMAADTGLTVGAAVTLNQFAADDRVCRGYPLLAQAAKSVASYQVRNRATLTGNLCNASPCADTSPAALVLEGEALLYGPAGSRRVSLSAFWTGPGQTSLGPAEFAVAVRFPVPPAGAVGRYLKLGRRKAGDLAVVGVAALAYADPELPSGYRFRLGLGSVGPVVFRAVQAEEHLAGEAPGDASFARAAEAAASASAPISDVRATAEYQRRMVRVLTLRALRDVWGQFEAAQAGERGA